jgi:hypothetical protein
VELQDATAAERGSGTCLVRNPGLDTRCAEPCSVWGNEGIDICSIPPISWFSVFPADELCGLLLMSGTDKINNTTTFRREGG